jgi:hypothetical protein
VFHRILERMMMHQLVDLAGPTAVGEPGPLPPELHGGEGEGLLDLSWMPAEYGYAGKGFWPLEPNDPTFDPAAETLGEPVTYTPVISRKVVKVRHTKRALTSEEIDARKPPPAAIGKVEFIRLVQTAGGMTDAMLVAAHEDVNLKPLWIKFQMASVVEIADPDTQGGLVALEALGYVPNGAAAVLQAWPSI